MNLVKRIIGADEARGVNAPVTFSDVFGKALDLFTGGSNTKAGKSVTQDTSLQVSTVWRCVFILSDNVSTLPLDSMVRRDGVPRPYRPRPEWLDFQVGPWDKIDVLGQAMVSLLLDGNAFLATYRDPSGTILWMEALDPSKVEPVRTSDGMIHYEIVQESGRIARLSPMDIKQIRGLTKAGDLRGLSPIAYAKETIGLARAATEFGGAFFGNGATPGSTIEVPEQLSEMGARILKSTWEDAHRGVGNSGKLAVLTEGAKFSQITVAPDQAQFLQTRQFQVGDIARLFGVPLHLLGQEGPQFGDTTSEQGVAFVQHSLRPWVERIEAALTWLIRSEDPTSRAFVNLNVDGLQRGNYGERMSAHMTAVNAGIRTINEVRKDEGWAPVEWGDEPVSVQVQPEAVDEEPEPEPESEEDTP